MTKEEIIKLASETAIDIWDKRNESKQERVEKKLRENTKKLLKDYKKLKAHAEQAIESTCKSKPSDLKLVIAEIFDKRGYIKVRSIMESKERTEVMLNHIDRMLEVYQKECKEEASLKYELLRLYYIEHKTEAEILATQPVGKTAFYDKLREAIDDMTLLIWGFSGAYVNA